MDGRGLHMWREGGRPLANDEGDAYHARDGEMFVCPVPPAATSPQQLPVGCLILYYHHR